MDVDANPGSDFAPADVESTGCFNCLIRGTIFNLFIYRPLGRIKLLKGFGRECLLP